MDINNLKGIITEIGSKLNSKFKVSLNKDFDVFIKIKYALVCFNIVFNEEEVEVVFGNIRNNEFIVIESKTISKQDQIMLVDKIVASVYEMFKKYYGV